MNNVIYILSASHSGSTLLAMLLGAQKEICTIGELNLTHMGDINKYRCSCKKLIVECEFWNTVCDRMRDKSLPFSITSAGTNFSTVESRLARRLNKPLLHGPALEKVRDIGLNFLPQWRRSVPEVRQRNVALVETVCSIHNKRFIADSSKSALRLKYLLRTPGLNVKVIRLIRDGRGVMLTYMEPHTFADSKNPSMWSGGTGTVNESEFYPAQRAAYAWRRAVQEQENIIRHLDRSQFIEVHYEDVCTNTAPTLGRILKFVGADPADLVLDFRSVDHHVVGNGMRLDSTSEIKLDDRWKQRLSSEDLKTFDSIAGDFNRKYGYE